jgi:TetR/AcrR family transcriptional regulator
MFVLWAVTQAYADHAAQFALLLGKPALDARDFAAARRVIEALVLGGLRPGSEPRPAAKAERRPPGRRRQD